MMQEQDPYTPYYNDRAGLVGTEAAQLAGVEGMAAGPETQLGEYNKLQNIMDMSEVLGKCDLIAIGDAGYVISIKNTPPISGNDWVMFDLDDTLIAYTSAKNARQNNFEQYAKSEGLNINEEQLKELMSITDTFSRWQDGESVMYHLDAHKLALGWAIARIRSVPGEEVDTVIESVKKSFLPVAADFVKTDIINEAKTPFRFENDKLISTFTEYDSSLDIVFNAMLKPPSYDDVIASMRDIASSDDPATKLNVGICTYGEPEFQLNKIINLMESQVELGRGLPISQIWLTKASKGLFMDELVKTTYAEQSRVAPVNSLKAELFDKAPHVIMLIDDNPKELDDFSKRNAATFALTGTRLARMRLIKTDTKSESNEWGLLGHRLHMNIGVGIFDARSGDGFLTPTMYKYLTSNLSWALKNRYEISTSLDPALASRLNNRVEFYTKNAEGADMTSGMFKVLFDDTKAQQGS